LPRTNIRPPAEFFARCEADLKDPLVISGELYFELHRGTYTSQARNKKLNRLSEFLLRDTELLSTLAWVTCSQAYPHSELQKLWEVLLTNQFHDIIPGSSIGEVYQDSTRDYELILSQAGELRDAALQMLLPTDSVASKLAVFNSLSFPRTEVIELPDGMAGAQLSSSGHALGMVQVPAFGLSIQTPIEPLQPVTVIHTETGFILENSCLRAVINRQGGLTSLFEKVAQRESIEPGQAGNTFVMYEDLPNAWEAWDMDVYHLEKRLPMNAASSAQVLEEGPLRVSIVFEYSISPLSSIRQVVTLDALSSRLDFSCDVDWHEKQKFLKVEFPLNIRSAFATYEIQFGHVQRPTHFNTSYDMARFEVPAHKWADLSEPDFGVALLNDCKFGYAAHGNILRLSLLRAPIYPDPDADQGQHQFRYALYPHQAGPQVAAVTEEAYRFNVPLLVRKSAGLDQQQSYFQVDHASIIVDTVKKAEDSQSVIVRMYEARGTRGTLRLTSSLPFQSAALVNILEDELSVLNWQQGTVEVNFKPFEIITLRLAL
jgi:alpha-mannosidase